MTLSEKKRIIAWWVLLFSLFFAFCEASGKSVWSDVERIVAIGDIHGDYDHFVKILWAAELVNENLNWIGGKTHLVQLGDIMDRGPDARKILDLLMRLEKQATVAKGKVHVLLGNHEEANLLGIAFDTEGYVSSEQFVSFLPEDFKDKTEKEFETNTAFSFASKEERQEVLQNYWRQVMKNDPAARDEYFSFFYDYYGKWLIKKNVAIKINDAVFVHGGISQKFSTWKLEDINDRARKELRFLRKRVYIEPKIVYASEGPLWFRGLIHNDENEFKESVDLILKNLNANYIVVGHSVRNKEYLKDLNLSRFDGRVWGMDTGISRGYQGILSALIIEKGVFKKWGEEYE